LNSEFVGELSVDTHLIVLDVEEISQNDSPSARRAKVADALARVPLGWVTVAKGGTDNLARVFSSVRTSPRIPLKQLMTRSPNGVRPPKVSLGSAAWVAAVDKCVLFDGYREPALVRYVEQAARPINTRIGELLYSQDDFPNMMYLVHSGSYRATIETAGGQTLARDYGPSDCFGACELLCVVGGRSCTVSVLEDGIVWGLPRHVVQWKLNIPPPITIPGLLDFCSRVRLFAKLSRQRLVQLCRGATHLRLKPDALLCEEGQRATEIYVLVDGEVITYKLASGFSLTLTNPTESFGESSLFAGEEMRVRGASIKAGPTGASLLTWNVSAIEALVGFELQAASHALFSRKMIESVRCAGRLFVQGLGKEQIDMLLDDAMLEQGVPDKAVVVSEGDVDQAFYIIKAGEAVAVRGKGGRVHLATLGRGDCFGEAALSMLEGVALSRRVKRKASIVAHGSNLVLLALTPQALAQQPGIEGWWQQLANGALATSTGITHGVDSVVAEKVQANGGNLSSLLTKQVVKDRDGREIRRPPEGEDPLDA